MPEIILLIFFSLLMAWGTKGMILDARRDNRKRAVHFRKFAEDNGFEFSNFENRDVLGQIFAQYDGVIVSLRNCPSLKKDKLNIVEISPNIRCRPAEYYAFTTWFLFRSKTNIPDFLIYQPDFQTQSFSRHFLGYRKAKLYSPIDLSANVNFSRRFSCLSQNVDQATLLLGSQFQDLAVKNRGIITIRGFENYLCFNFSPYNRLGVWELEEWACDAQQLFSSLNL